MGIAKMPTLADLLAPLQTLASRWTASRHTRSSPMRYVAVRPACVTGGTAPVGSSSLRPAGIAKPLRVVRQVDAQRPHAASRLMISGRMDDVCAELARLAALEGPDLAHCAPHLH